MACRAGHGARLCDPSMQGHRDKRTVSSRLSGPCSQTVSKIKEKEEGEREKEGGRKKEGLMISIKIFEGPDWELLGHF